MTCSRGDGFVWKMSDVNAFALLGQADGIKPNKSGKAKKKHKKKNQIGVSDTTIAPPAIVDLGLLGNEDDDLSFQVVRHRGKHSRSSSRSISGMEHVSASIPSVDSLVSFPCGQHRRALLRRWHNELACSNEKLREAFSRESTIETLFSVHIEAAEPLDASALGALLALTAHETISTAVSDGLAEMATSCGSLMATDPSLMSRHEIAKISRLAAKLIVRGIPSAGELFIASTEDEGIQESLKIRSDAVETALRHPGSTKDQSKQIEGLMGVLRTALDAILVDSNGSAEAVVDVPGVVQELEKLQTVLVSRQHMTRDSRRHVACGAEALKKEFQREDDRLSKVEEEARSWLQHCQEQLVAAEERLERVRAERSHHELQLEKSMAQIDIVYNKEAKGKYPSLLAERLESVIRDIRNVKAALNVACTDLRQNASAPSAKSQQQQKAGQTIANRNTEHDIAVMSIGALQKILEACTRQFSNAQARFKFYRHRLQASDREVQHLQARGDIHALAEHRKQRAALEQMISDVVFLASEAQCRLQTVATLWHKHGARLLKCVGGDDALALKESVSKTLEETSSLSESAFNEYAEIQMHCIATKRTINNDKGLLANHKASRSLIASGASTPTLNGSDSVETGTPGDDAVIPSRLESRENYEVFILEQRLAELESENRRKDQQIAAMLAAASVDIPSLSTPPAHRKGLPSS